MSNAMAATLFRWVQPLVSADMFDFWAQKLSPTLAWDRTLAKVVERRLEAKDAVTLVLKPNRRFAGFLPGQHVNVTVEVAGRRLTRSYSLTDVPRADRLISITVKRMEGGKVSTHLCTGVKEGDVLELGPAFGELTLGTDQAEPWLFLAAGSGITPLMSLIRALARPGEARPGEARPGETRPGEAQPGAAKSSMTRPVTLLYWARTRAEVCFLQELKTLAAREPNFQVQFFLTREPELLPGELSGRADLQTLEQLVPDLARRKVYACGPAGFVQAIETLVRPIAASFGAESFTPLALDEAEVGDVKVQLAVTGCTLILPKGQPLLQALEAQGVYPVHGCRMGICKTCVCRKTAGTTQDLLTGEQDSEATDALRICVSSARSDLTLDL